MPLKDVDSLNVRIASDSAILAQWLHGDSKVEMEKLYEKNRISSCYQNRTNQVVSHNYNALKALIHWAPLKVALKFLQP